MSSRHDSAHGAVVVIDAPEHHCRCAALATLIADAVRARRADRHAIDDARLSRLAASTARSDPVAGAPDVAGAASPPLATRGLQTCGVAAAGVVLPVLGSAVAPR